nr:acetyltransferase [Clostridium polynesiense]
MNRLIIIGASGHGKVVADIAIKKGYTDIVFLDDDASLKECAGYPIVGKTTDAKDMFGDKIVAIGNADIRCEFQNQLDNIISLIHPAAVISRRVHIGKGTVVMAGAIINSDTLIGDGCIINTGATVDHDCMIHNYVHVSVGAHVAGTCEIGNRTWVGAGSVISNNVNICNDCMIGAGAVVVSDLVKSGTYIGVPVKRVR